jgi:hypothetical protein
MKPFAGWENFYVITGSSAGALIGLQFVVMTLLASLPARRGNAQAGGAYATPTVVHFGAVLLLAGIMTVPWEATGPAAVLWGAVGFIGVFYALNIARRMRFQTAYRPEMEDWVFHAVFPLVAYGGLAAAAVEMNAHAQAALFGNAAAAMVLLFVGIHNSWDAVIYHLFTQKKEE